MQYLFGYDHFVSGRILHDKAVPSETRVAMLRLMAFGAGQDDIVLILHSDRKDHLVMNYAQDFDRLPIFEQEAVAVFVSIVCPDILLTIHLIFSYIHRVTHNLYSIVCKLV